MPMPDAIVVRSFSHSDHRMASRKVPWSGLEVLKSLLDAASALRVIPQTKAFWNPRPKQAIGEGMAVDTKIGWTFRNPV